MNTHPGPQDGGADGFFELWRLPTNACRYLGSYQAWPMCNKSFVHNLCEVSNRATLWDTLEHIFLVGRWAMENYGSTNDYFAYFWQRFPKSRFPKYPEKLPNIWATFVKKFVAQTFQE